MIYLDNAATTAPSPLCVKAVYEVLTDCFANPSSLYSAGLHSSKALLSARRELALVMGVVLSVQAPELIFTASGSEANNIAIFSAARARRAWGNHIVVTAYEHPSALLACEALKSEGFELSVISPQASGNISEEQIVSAVTKQTVLVCAMHVNNETGAIISPQSLAAKVKALNSRTAVHIDGVQAFCKLPLALQNTQIDTYAISGHKLHAPKGIGALYIRKGFNIVPVLHGGGQERALRPGTENIAYASAFAACAKEASARRQSAQAHIVQLSDRLWAGLFELGGILQNSPKDAYKGIANFSVTGVKSQPMLNALDARGICVSSGSACSRGNISHTLSAMGLTSDRIDSALRVSFNADNTFSDVDALLLALKELIPQIARAK